MLDKNDLKQIRSIVREEIEVEVREAKTDISAETKLVRLELSDRLDKIEDRGKNLEIKVDNIEKQVKKISKKATQINKTLDKTIDHFDKRDVNREKRIKKIEAHLNLPVI